MATYWQSTRHPAPCLLFLTPLLVAYEYGVLSLGGAQPLTLRNGADAWLRDGLTALGAQHPAAAPALILAVVGVWFWRQRFTTPEDLPSLCLGMAVESVAAALLLWGLSRGFAPLVDYLGVPLAAPPVLNVAAFGQVVTYVGAGVYEEVMFR